MGVIIYNSIKLKVRTVFLATKPKMAVKIAAIMTVVLENLSY